MPAAFATTPVPQSSPSPRLLPPLIEPYVRISRIRLSDQVHSGGMHDVASSRLAFRHSFRCSVWIFSGVARLIVNRLDPVLLRPHPGTRAPSLHRHYPASAVLRAPPPPAPARRLVRLLARPTWPPRRASRVARYSLLTCCHPPPRRSGPGSSSSASRSMAAFPQSRQGRPSHRDFRGRLGVHSRYGLPACRQPEAASFLPGFSRFVASTTAEIATRLGRPLPGRDFHPLE